MDAGSARTPYWIRQSIGQAFFRLPRGPPGASAASGRRSPSTRRERLRQFTAAATAVELAGFPGWEADRAVGPARAGRLCRRTRSTTRSRLAHADRASLPRTTISDDDAGSRMSASLLAHVGALAIEQHAGRGFRFGLGATSSHPVDAVADIRGCPGTVVQGRTRAMLKLARTGRMSSRSDSELPAREHHR